jgi:hypothetical protein
MEGYNSTYDTSTNYIISCDSQCSYSNEVFLNIPFISLYDSCQVNLWANNEILNYKYDLLYNIDDIRETSQKELNALTTFYLELNGDIWINKNNWNNGDPCINNWYGIICNKRGNIIGINFDENNLHGILSDNVIQNLTYLKYIRLYNTLFENNLNYSNSIFYISNKLFYLENLQEIVIKNVKLQQNLSNIIQISNINNNLEIIDLSFNYIFGNLVNFSNYVNLKEINLSNNNLSGDLSFLNTLSSTMKNIIVYNNFFNGELPSLDNLNDNLEFLDLRNNTYLNGSIPANFLSENFFPNLKYLGLMLTKINVPWQCENSPFCIKKYFKNNKSIYDNDFNLTDNEIQFLIERN